MYPENFDERKRNGALETGAFRSVETDISSSNGEKEKEPFKWDGTWESTRPSLGSGMWSEPFDPEKSEGRFRKSFTDYMLPKDTPYRRRSQYALSQGALDDVVNDYYNSELRGRFQINRDASKKRGRDEYMSYAGVVGGNPELAMHRSLAVDDPMRVIDKTMGEVDNDYLVKLVTPLANYGGYDVNDYIEKFVKPSLRDKMVNEYVEENRPRSRAEYVLRSSLGNSLIGKAATIALDGKVGSDTHSALSNEGLGRFESSRFDDFAGGVGSLLVDAPVFSAIGGVYGSLMGKGVKWATKRAAANIMARSTNPYMSEKFAHKIAERAIVKSLSSKMLQSSLGQGLTLGTYDAANSVADDILYGSGVSSGKAAGAFARGFFTGGAAGAVGAGLRHASAGLTGGKKLLSSAGVLSAESAVFTAAGEVDKAIHGVEIEPIDLLYDFTEGTATLLTMKMANWRPRGSRLKLDSNGRLREKFRLTDSERREISMHNINPEDFMRAMEIELKTPSFRGENAEKIKRQYTELMSSSDISASTRSKLMFLVENKLTSTPPVVFDYKAGELADGRWFITTYDEGGRVIGTENFRDAEGAKSYLVVNKGDIRRNRIAFFERELTQGLDSQNFLRQAGLYAREKGVDMEHLSEVLYKKANGEKLAVEEEGIVDEILKRAVYDETGMVQFLHNVRMAIERKYELPQGSLMTVVDKKFYNCSKVQNIALDEYEAYIRAEVERLKDGASPTFASEIARLGENSGYRGKTNRMAIDEEIAGYEAWVREQEAERANDKSKPLKATLRDISKLKWSPELVEELNTHIPRLQKLFNYEINVIKTPTDLELPAPNDYYGIIDYNTQLDAQGWYGRNKVYVNLMNIKSVEQLERTVAHEVVGHAGLEKLFGNYYNEFLEEVYKHADKHVRDEIMKQKAANPLYDDVLLTEEYLAGLVEKSYLTRNQRSIMERFKEFVRNMLVRLNIYSGKNRSISEDELMKLLRRHCNYVIKRKEAPAYRQEVFGDFEAARRDEGGYYDNSIYKAGVRERVTDGTYFSGTPDGFLNRKIDNAYYALPKEERGILGDLIERRRDELAKRRDEVRYRFIGKKGAENLALMEGEHEDAGLEAAKRLEEKGEIAPVIKLQTGWERGIDGKWRYEVGEKSGYLLDPVYEFYLKDDPVKSELYNRYKDTPYSMWPKRLKSIWKNAGDFSGKKVMVSDILNDYDFLAAYPDIADMPVRIVNGMKEPAFYDGNKKELLINRNAFLDRNTEVHLAGVLQNIVQDYEGFSKAVSYRVLAKNRKLRDEYYGIRKFADNLGQLRSAMPDFDKDDNFGRMFMREYGMSVDEFNRRFPTFDDYLYYRSSGKNLSFSGDVEVDNVKRRYGMGEWERRLSLAEETEAVPRNRQIPVRTLADMEKYLTGPVDLIRKGLRRYISDEPLRMEERLYGEMPAYKYLEMAEKIGEFLGPMLRKEWNKHNPERPVRTWNRVYDDEAGTFRKVKEGEGEYNDDDLTGN